MTRRRRSVVGDELRYENSRIAGQKIESVVPVSLLTLMYFLVFQGELFGVLMASLVAQCSIFETTPALLAKPYDVQSRVSVDSFRTFVGAIGGTEPNITDNNAMDLWLLSDEFNFTTLSTAVAAWRAAHPSPGADVRLIPASLDQRLQSQAQDLCAHEEKVAELERELTELKKKVTHLKEEGTELKKRIKRIKMATPFRPSINKRRVYVEDGWWIINTTMEIDVPDGIIAHLTRECGGNVHDHHVVDVTSGSFERESYGANPDSGAYNNDPLWAAKNAADFETGSIFAAACRGRYDTITHTPNNWVCYDFKERRIVPTHYTIRTHGGDPGDCHLTSWLIETSADGERWREVDRMDDNEQLNGSYFTGTFAVAGGGECRFIRLAHIGREPCGTNCFKISAWEVYGSLIE